MGAAQRRFGFFTADPVTGEPFRNQRDGNGRTSRGRAGTVCAFHHVSSAYVKGNRTGVIPGPISIEARPSRIPTSGASSKWSNPRGIDTTIYRPSIIVGDRASERRPRRSRGLVWRCARSRARGARTRRDDVREALRAWGAGRRGQEPGSCRLVSRAGRPSDARGKMYHLRAAADHRPGHCSPPSMMPAPARPGTRSCRTVTILKHLRVPLRGRRHSSDDPAFDRTNLDHDVPHLPCLPVDRPSLVRQMRAGIRDAESVSHRARSSGSRLRSWAYSPAPARAISMSTADL